jgi:hypothetical protein
MSLTASDRSILDRRVRPLVTAQLIAEHRSDPFGQLGHSSELTEVLHFLRRNPDPDRARYLLVKAGEPPRWQVTARGARAGDPLRIVDDTRYPSRADAEHAVFLRRLGDYGLAADGLAADGLAR